MELVFVLYSKFQVTMNYDPSIPSIIHPSMVG
ncbi:MAG: hypothetical protein ACI8RD_012850, partial [Bacillariaceae sp.]